MSYKMRKTQYLWVVFIPAPTVIADIKQGFNYFPHTFFNKKRAKQFLALNPDIKAEIVKYKKEK